MIRLSYVILALLILASCGSNKEETEKPVSPRIRKKTSIASPTQNQNFVRGNTIQVTIEASDDFSIDSVQVSIDDQTTTYFNSSFDVTIPSQRVGSWRLLTKVYDGESSETHYRTVIVLPESEPEAYSLDVKNTYPHDTDDYTQGLLIKDGSLYESTGRRGASSFKKKNITTGETEKIVNLASDLFGEGLTLYKDEFYQLTWESGVGFVYNDQMEQVRTFNYQVQGWGLTTLNDELILTDETEKLYFIEPESFTVKREIQVYDNQGKIDSLNELEVIDGLIYANVYQEDYIVVVDPNTGEVLQKIDCSGLLSEAESDAADVLNGIAYDASNGRIYITGKWWPKLFEVTFQPKTI
ncbi:glutaminyl-peptide cyclotransferase [Ekhidna sp. To15]|uniref:glutaminyl-peptide cyclotransferase n=1 Tax=Ekhidna sp. To15 TaxID=3395267 RepID=UPI003F521F05